MSAPLTTRDGRDWQPQYVASIDQETCIGCGRCYKVCSRNVLALMGLNEDDEWVDPQDDEAERKVMTIADAGDCIGCQACSKVCPKGCYTHAVAA
ncbi:ferredoxin III, nif-specific [Plasticicumulans sp.]|uniref:ferredoxin III, nif-specific n=1 Tax=Plasticicumulans sp. TaxID=2307179 RepID=UPI002C3447D4|nr:ferredoxin III, nif-specific [Plasticicumulans sp.]MBS0602108.1 ferredoxin III, nif-specific [Pseudomonadota bacterium]HMV38324.1 ferredoxin III, nif-specific [Plasticicumulans sp.]HMW30341.1 ferredoxin III, nif-specific [Plasticicumulans sp.]HMW42183.1 ferredoxin III, nif-specific [Plasticicumulans sp.]HMX52885.1 ferredoxin III, nif-specific [Plasticicumulans sp.]